MAMDDHTVLTLWVLETAEAALVRATNLVSFNASEEDRINGILGLIIRYKLDLIRRARA